MKKINFITGLPRSGSTLLTNILLQNPNFYSSTTSSLLELLIQLRNNWDSFVGHKANPIGQDKWKVMKSVLENYHNTDKDVVFDKSRGWMDKIEFIEKLNGPSKFIVCVRNMEDIVTSFEKLYRKNRAEFEINSESNNIKMKTLKGRIELWTDENGGVIGSPFVSMIDAFNRGLGDKMLIVPYEGLTYHPESWLQKIYQFIGEPEFKHDFQNVKQIYKENDEFFGWGDDLHTIKEGPVEFRESDAVNVIGQQWIEKLKGNNIWKN